MCREINTISKLVMRCGIDCELVERIVFYFFPIFRFEVGGKKLIPDISAHCYDKCVRDVNIFEKYPFIKSR